MLDFAGKRWWYLSISLVMFIAAAVILAIPPHLRPGIEFTSGSSFSEKFEKPTTVSALRSEMAALGYSDSRVQSQGNNTFLFRTRTLEGSPQQSGEAQGPAQPGELDVIEQNLIKQFGPLTRQDFQTVSGTVSSEIARNATIAVIAASVAILIYISLAFRKLDRPWRYGSCAIVALLHDAFIVGLLTVIGFSVHDTIVVFDRIRENVIHDPYIPFEENVNASLTDTLARSINTSLVVVLTVVTMLLIGGETIRSFLLVLLVGIISGTYSSIGIATQLVVALENNDIGRFFRRITGRSKPRRRVEADQGTVEAVQS
ncbi:protein translocase subunit SecF [bacterium]|nr:protein translocase subunit SecF [bacterium]